MVEVRPPGWLEVDAQDELHGAGIGGAGDLAEAVLEFTARVEV